MKLDMQALTVAVGQDVEANFPVQEDSTTEGMDCAQKQQGASSEFSVFSFPHGQPLEVLHLFHRQDSALAGGLPQRLPAVSAFSAVPCLPRFNGLSGECLRSLQAFLKR